MQSNLTKQIRAAIEAKNQAEEAMNKLSKTFEDMDLDEPSNWAALGFAAEAKEYAEKRAAYDLLEAKDDETWTDEEAERYDQLDEEMSDLRSKVETFAEELNEELVEAGAF
jgi:hypothetical protein